MIKWIKGNCKKHKHKRLWEKSEEDLIKILSEPKPKIDLSKKKVVKINQIEKDFSELKYGFSKSKIKKIRRSLYNIKIQKNLSLPEIKETKQIFLN